MSTSGGTSFDALWAQLEPMGRTSAGGYRRFAWNDADLAAREWFTSAAGDRGLDVQPDRNGNLWAWWLPDGHTGEPVGAFATGSHLDSVPDGGAYDGPLGVVSALAAVDLLKAQGVRPVRPLAVVVFADEEGARFGVACAGSRLASGALTPDRARGLRDVDGISMAEAMTRAGHDPAGLGPDPEALGRLATFVELHIEQGRALVDLGVPVAVGTGVWPHGRWRFTFTGEANHAGTTLLDDRRDPMIAFATAVGAAREVAWTHGGLATIGRVEVEPNATNAVPSRVTVWLDARAPDQQSLDAIVAGVELAARLRASIDRVGVEVVAESVTAEVTFAGSVAVMLDGVVTDRLQCGTPSIATPHLSTPHLSTPHLSTGAGHDAGVLASTIDTGMLFVRNPTGVSHAPAEFAERDDCLAGVEALAAVMTAAVRS